MVQCTVLCKSILGFLMLYAVTFSIILPLFCHNRPFSRLYFHSSRTIGGAIRNDVIKGHKADEYFARLDPKASQAFQIEPKKMQSPLKYAIGVITIKRRSAQYRAYTPRYLARVVAEFDRQLKETNRRDIVLFICNVDSVPKQHKEAWNLTKYVRSVWKSGEDLQSPTASAREQEKRDYVFCMKQIETLKAQYSILVEDDAVPYSRFITSLDRLLQTRFENRFSRGELVPNPDNWTAVKFYFPEKWQGYGNEPRLIWEFICASLLGGGILYGLFTLCTFPFKWIASFAIFALFCIYFGISIFVIGRPYLQMLRLLAVDLYAVRGAPSCCTPAVLYKTESLSHIRRNLTGVTCSSRYPLDIAISRYLRDTGNKQYLVEPNLVNHIGVFSSLTQGAKSPHTFLN